MSLRRVGTLARRIVAQFRRDHRTLALLFVVPIVVTALLGWIVDGAGAHPPRLVTVVQDPALASVLDTALRDVDPDTLGYLGAVDDEAAGRTRLVDRAADVVLVVPVGTAAAVAGGRAPTLRVLTLGLDPVADGAAVAATAQVIARGFAGASGTPVPEIERATVYGSADADQLDALGPVFLAFFGYFFVFILTGVSFLRERIGGTLERLLATPVTRGEIVAGYSVGFGLFAGLQVAVLLAFALADIAVPAIGPLPAFSIGLGIGNAGSPLLVFVVALLLALGSVNLAILLSTFARTELQILQFIPLVIVPQGLLGGLIWPVESLPGPLEALSRVLPLRYGIEAMRGVLVRGAGLDDATLQGDLIVLAGIAIAFVLLASRTIRREII